MYRTEGKTIQNKMYTALELFMRAEQMGHKTTIGPILQLSQQYRDKALY